MRPVPPQRERSGFNGAAATQSLATDAGSALTGKNAHRHTHTPTHTWQCRSGSAGARTGRPARARCAAARPPRCAPQSPAQKGLPGDEGPGKSARPPTGGSASLWRNAWSVCRPLRSGPPAGGRRRRHLPAPALASSAASPPGPLRWWPWRQGGPACWSQAWRGRPWTCTGSTRHEHRQAGAWTPTGPAESSNTDTRITQ